MYHKSVHSFTAFIYNCTVNSALKMPSAKFPQYLTKEQENELRQIANAIATPGKGILAADESTGKRHTNKQYCYYSFSVCFVLISVLQENLKMLLVLRSITCSLRAVIMVMNFRYHWQAFCSDQRWERWGKSPPVPSASIHSRQRALQQYQVCSLPSKKLLTYQSDISVFDGMLHVLSILNAAYL